MLSTDSSDKRQHMQMSWRIFLCLQQPVCASAHFVDISTHANFKPALIAVYTGVPSETVNKFGICYTVSGITFNVCYSYIETQRMSYLRSVAWWSSNISCFTGLVAAARKLQFA